MKKGTRVSWINALKIESEGTVVSDQDDEECVLVAMDAKPNMEHVVIYCAVTWLTEIV